MGVGAGLYMYDVVVKTFTFAVSSTDEFLWILLIGIHYTQANLREGGQGIQGPQHAKICFFSRALLRYKLYVRCENE